MLTHTCYIRSEAKYVKGTYVLLWYVCTSTMKALSAKKLKTISYHRHILYTEKRIFEHLKKQQHNRQATNKRVCFFAPQSHTARARPAPYLSFSSCGAPVVVSPPLTQSTSVAKTLILFHHSRPTTQDTRRPTEEPRGRHHFIAAKTVGG